jgi:hypothetical protein
VNGVLEDSCPGLGSAQAPESADMNLPGWDRDRRCALESSTRIAGRMNTEFGKYATKGKLADTCSPAALPHHRSRDVPAKYLTQSRLMKHPARSCN